MIGKYIKRPVIITAVQFDGYNYEECIKFIDGNDYIINPEGIFILTPEGTMKVSPMDYIIKGVNGEFYPCKPNIFKYTYDGVVDTCDQSLNF